MYSKKVNLLNLAFTDGFAVHGKAVQMAQHRLLPPLLQFMRWFAAKTRSVYSSELDIHLTYHCVSLRRSASRETMFHQDFPPLNYNSYYSTLYHNFNLRNDDH